MKISHLVPPVAPAKPSVLVAHGDERFDSYFWLNDRTDEEVIDYLEAENDYTKQVLAPYDSLQNEIYEEIIARIQQNDSSVPFYLNDYFYQIRFAENLQYPFLYRSKWEDFSTKINWQKDNHIINYLLLIQVIVISIWFIQKTL